MSGARRARRKPIASASGYRSTHCPPGAITQAETDAGMIRHPNVTRSLHLGEIEVERFCDVAQRVVVLVGDRIEACDRPHLAEREILHAVKRFANLLLHVLRQRLAV